MTSRTLSTSAGLASAGVSGPIVNNAVAASIAACNAGDRAAWLACYHPDVVWEIIDDRTLRGIAELATLWEAMVLGTGERSVSFEGHVVDAAGEPWIAAVVTHAGGLDTIVCCELDDRGRIRTARSYRQGDRDPYRVFENRTAREIATYRPRSVDALQAIWGIGSKRASWFGRDVLAIVDEWEREHPEATPAPALPAQTSLGSRSRSAADDGPEVRPDDPLFQALRAWRSERAKAEGLPAYTVFSDRTLRELVTVKPRNVHALLGVWGLGESRVERFGPELVRVIREAEAAAAE